MRMTLQCLSRCSTLSWTGSDVVDKQTIVAHPVAFLDRYVNGAAEDGLLRRKPSSVAAFRRAPAAK
jgi:hypothetical protein